MPVSDATVITWWTIALGLTLVVAIVVAALLEGIVRSAARIHNGVAQIWAGGGRIAANTVTIALLRRTNDLAAVLLDSAAGIAAASGRIRAAVARR